MKLSNEARSDVRGGTQGRLQRFGADKLIQMGMHYDSKYIYLGSRPGLTASQRTCDQEVLGSRPGYKSQNLKINLSLTR